MAESAVPTMPMRDINETAETYQKLGFRIVHRYDGEVPYLIVRRGEIEIHFFGLEGLDPAESYGGCYVRTDDVDEVFRAFAAARVGTLHPISLKPWGLREFALIDPNGNLLRVGATVADPDADLVLSRPAGERS